MSPLAPVNVRKRSCFEFELLPWCILAAVAALRFCSSDVFLDGVVYATLSRNLAIGEGSFWAPYYTAEIQRFSQHPPFAIWAQSGLFRLFGDQSWVEKVGGALLAILAVWLVGHRWRSHFERESESVNTVGHLTPNWVPRLLLALCPGFSWCACNNMLESMVVVLALAATAILAGQLKESSASRIRYRALAGGICIGLALLTKGVSAAFLLAVPAALRLEGLAWRKIGSTYVGALLGILAALSAAALVDPAQAAQFGREYAHDQLLASLLGQRELAPTLGYLPKAIALDLLGPLVVTALLVSVRRSREVAPGLRFYAAIALTASLPFLALKKQMAWYGVPSYPFWAMALGCLVSAQPRPKFRMMLRVAGLPLLVVTTFILATHSGSLDRAVGVSLRDAIKASIGYPRPDPRQSEYCWHFFRSDVLRNPNAPRNRVVSSRFGTCDFRSVAYAARHLRVTLTPRAIGELLLVEQTYPRVEPSNCKSLGPSRSRYELFHCSHTQSSERSD